MIFVYKGITMLLNKSIVLGVCFATLVMVFSCDNKERELQIRKEAGRDIVNKNIVNKALKDSIIIEDNKIFGLVSKIDEHKELSAFKAKLKASNLDECLIKKGEFTVFAPHNDAFKKSNSTIFNKNSKTYNSTKGSVKKALKYHVIEDKWTVSLLEEKIINEGGVLKLQTKSGASIKANIDKDDIVLKDETGNTARIITSDIAASNGTLYIIDTVLSAD